MAKLLSRTFKSLKPHSISVPTLATPTKSSQSPSKSLPKSSSKEPSSSVSRNSTRNSWTVYLIVSTNRPIKTYVGVTNNFSRRLKQHNGEITGGAKASRAGRPWICACHIQGFSNKSKAQQIDADEWMVALPLRRSDLKDE